MTYITPERLTFAFTQMTPEHGGLFERFANAFLEPIRLPNHVAASIRSAG
jgi:hypothetical protein